MAGIRTTVYYFEYETWQADSSMWTTNWNKCTLWWFLLIRPSDPMWLYRIESMNTFHHLYYFHFLSSHRPYPPCSSSCRSFALSVDRFSRSLAHSLTHIHVPIPPNVRWCTIINYICRSWLSIIYGFQLCGMAHIQFQFSMWDVFGFSLFPFSFFFSFLGNLCRKRNRKRNQ